MMVSKWQKWKIGGSVTLILGLGFTAIRNDPAFAAAHDKAVAMGGNQQGGTVVKQQESDRVLQEFVGQERRRPQGEANERRGGREVENETRGGVAMGPAPNGGARGGSGGSVSNGGNASSGGNTATSKNGLGASTPNSGTQSVVPQQRTRSKHS
jgi:hypothetical protein